MVSNRLMGSSSRLARSRACGMSGRVLEAVVHLHLPEARHQRLDLHAVGSAHPRHVLEDHRQDQVALMQHLVVLAGCASAPAARCRVRHGVDGRALRRVARCRRPGPGRRQQLRVALARCSRSAARGRAASSPSPRRSRCPSTSGNQPPCMNLSEQAMTSSRSTARKTPVAASPATAEAPGVPHHEEGQQRRREHGDRHGDAIGRGQRRRTAEADHGQQHRDQQQPVDQRACRSGRSPWRRCSCICMRGSSPSCMACLVSE